MSEEMDIPFLGSIPLDPEIADAGDSGRAFVQHFRDSPAAEIIQKIADSAGLRRADGGERPQTGHRMNGDVRA